MKVFVVGLGEIFAVGAGFVERGRDLGDAIARRQGRPAPLNQRIASRRDLRLRPERGRDHLFSVFGGGLQSELPSGAKAPTVVTVFTARLKSCPFKTPST